MFYVGFLIAMKALILIFLLSGCATQDPAIKDACSKPYADTDARCAKKKVVSTKGLVQFCQGRSHGNLTCTWITRDELQRILQQMGL